MSGDSPSSVPFHTFTRELVQFHSQLEHMLSGDENAWYSSTWQALESYVSDWT